MVALHVEMSEKALFFKTISVHEQRDFDGYRRVPDNFTLEQAAELVGGAPRQGAENTPK
jgi:hypothetical protein